MLSTIPLSGWQTHDFQVAVTLDKQNTYYTYSICFFVWDWILYLLDFTYWDVFFLYLRTMLPLCQNNSPFHCMKIVKMCCSDITNIGCNTHRYFLSVYHSPSPQKRKKRALDEYPLSLLAIIPLTSPSFYTPTPTSHSLNCMTQSKLLLLSQHPPFSPSTRNILIPSIQQPTSFLAS